MNGDDPFRGLQTGLPLQRALEAWAVDLISQGAFNSDSRFVWGRCVAIAMSARRRGWHELDFVNAIANDGSKLWEQVRRRSNGKLRGDKAAYKDLANAWVMAGENLSDTGLRTGADLASDALELAFEWQDYLNSSNCPITGPDHAVLMYVADQTEQRKMRRVTCPRRHVAGAAGISADGARRALERLTERGLLIKHSAGTWSTKYPQSQKAAIYQLTDCPKEK